MAELIFAVQSLLANRSLAPNFYAALGNSNQRGASHRRREILKNVAVNALTTEAQRHRVRIDDRSLRPGAQVSLPQGAIAVPELVIQ